MTIQTRSSFLTIDEITDGNFRIDFNEGSGEIITTVEIGSHSIEQLMIKIASAMNSAGDNEYTVSFNRTTRKVTISTTVAFDLLVSSGSSGSTAIFDLIGFTGADRTGLSSYTGDSEVGFLYRPQFKLQEYIDHEDFQEAASASVNEAASGELEIIKFGNREFFQFNIKYINNFSHAKGGPVEENLQGIEDARTFMRFCTTKSPVEFMPDRDSPALFDTILLESTRSNKKGVGYRLKELIGQGLAGYFETGRLKFRKV